MFCATFSCPTFTFSPIQNLPYILCLGEIKKLKITLHKLWFGLHMFRFYKLLEVSLEIMITVLIQSTEIKACRGICSASKSIRLARQRNLICFG